MTPSELFIEAFSTHSAGCLRECACGVTYYDSSETSSWTWEEGELEAIEEAAKTHPDKYIDRGEPIRTMSMGGEEFVIGCDECEVPGITEEILLSDYRKIGVYFLGKVLEEEKTIVEMKMVAQCTAAWEKKKKGK